jgi:DUF1365 family protein
MTHSALYDGTVIHQRLRPVRHRLRYRIFQLLLDLDELPALGQRLKLFSHDRRGLFSFHERDHGGGVAGGLRAWVEDQLFRAGIDTAGGAIRLLCMPRILGHAFNPISVYFCHGASGELLAMLYEVRNTFGGKHSYVMPVAPGATHVQQACDKNFHVSPFLPMQLRYRFRTKPPGETLSLGITASDTDGMVIATALGAARQPLTDRALLHQFLRMPLQGAKVLAAIHFEAARLWLRGARLYPQPQPRRLPARGRTGVGVAPSPTGKPRPGIAKVFCFFFSKKKTFLPPLPGAPNAAD